MTPVHITVCELCWSLVQFSAHGRYSVIVEIMHEFSSIKIMNDISLHLRNRKLTNLPMKLKYINSMKYKGL